MRPAEALVERLDPEPRRHEPLELGVAHDELPRPKPPWIAEPEIFQVIEFNSHPRVGRRFACLPFGTEGPSGGRARLQQEGPRHPQMHQQVNLPAELPIQVLAVARQALDLASKHGIGERFRRKRFAPARIEDLEANQPPPLNHRSELAANRLNLRQLRHRRRPPTRR